MDRSDATKILTTIKIAYPSAFKEISKDDAYAMIAMWERKFSAVPVDLVFAAVDSLIATSKFPPSISDVLEELQKIYDRNFMFKWASDCGTLELPSARKAEVDYIHRALGELVDRENHSALVGASNTKFLEG